MTNASLEQQAIDYMTNHPTSGISSSEFWDLRMQDCLHRRDHYGARYAMFKSLKASLAELPPECLEEIKSLFADETQGQEETTPKQP